MPDSNPTYKHLLRLLRFSLYEPQGSGCTLGMSLSERQWYKMLDEAEKQTVTGIVFPAISCLPDEEMPSVSVLATWLAMANRYSSRYHAMTGVLSGLFKTFEANGLHPVLQKGHAASRFYSAPELRASGDIDLWFPGEELEAADALIRGLGHKVIHTPDNGSCYIAGSIEVEHHSMLIEVHNPFRTGLIRELCGSYPHRQVELSSGVAVTVPSPMIELLMMNVHILKHCLGIGIGMRQFCDYAMAWRGLTGAGADAVDADLYFEMCSKLGIMKWTRVLHGFVNRYLPMPDGTAAVAEIGGTSDDVAIERIYNLVCEGGNFGKFNSSRRSTRSMNMVQRKFYTMSAFINNRSYVSRLVPFEAFWTFSRLLLGQIH